ncbi:hypothetical protein HDF16_003728 [Granulicella aggregans]|uniref:DUF4197 domain-containing protein n=1 Tax=Granulicella aggregans TaxID=474949 RepID=A0A7W7ZFJ2_9BACT|nr:DUF4197 domain-containing protein [Granulicella aggregans]MBB5059005.1 hypothetical protein [Granulicella aggregans]
MTTQAVGYFKRVVAVSAIVFSAGSQVGRAQIDIASLTSAQAGDGLKEALSRGISTAVSSTGKPGGYFDDATIKILMPPSLQKVEKGLRSVGQGPRVDEFVKSMNSAAEEAAPAAKAIFMEALRSMTIEDAKGIVTGGNTAGTEYFKRTTSSKVADAFKPTIDKSMDKIGVTAQFKELMGNAPAIPFMKTPSVDINAYVLEKAVGGLFVVMGQEETKIRTNPSAQVTPLLKKVFGGRL